MANNILTVTDKLEVAISTLRTKKLPNSTDDATATAEDILIGQTAYVKGEKITGTMPNNGAISIVFDGIETTSVTLPAGYTSGGSVSLDDTIDNEVDEQSDLIAQIQAVAETLPDKGSEEIDTIYDGLLSGELTSYSISGVSAIADYAFYNYLNLSSVEFPDVVTIGNSAFYRCSSLTTANFPKATTIGGYAFQNCSSLTTANFPNVTTIGGNAFAWCSSLTTANFPQATTISGYAFEYCKSLATISFPKATIIGNGAFYDCFNLKSLYLTGSSVCTLSKSNAFTSTPIAGYTASAGTYGSIYVPGSLINAYKSATNWTYFSSRFVGI